MPPKPILPSAYPLDEPGEVTVGGRAIDRVGYDSEARLLTIDTRPLSTRKAAVVRLEFGAEG